MKFAKLNKTGDNLVLQITPYCQTDMGVIPSISNNIDISPIPNRYFLVNNYACLQVLVENSVKLAKQLYCSKTFENLKPFHTSVYI